MRNLRSILILLSFVLITLASCTQPEQYIENCADYKTLTVVLKGRADRYRDFKIRVEKNITDYQVVPVLYPFRDEIPYRIKSKSDSDMMFGFSTHHSDGSITNSDGSLILKDGNIITISEVLEKEMTYRKSMISDFKNLLLQEKLKNNEYDYSWKETSYEYDFKECVKEFTKDEITFKAKWK